MFFANSILVLVAVTILIGSAGAQPRDHLTEPEMELVRNNQELDKRIDVFIKAADRRLAIIQGTVQAPSKKKKKDDELWGEMPKHSRTSTT
jgi:hypothetical protein